MPSAPTPSAIPKAILNEKLREPRRAFEKAHKDGDVKAIRALLDAHPDLVTPKLAEDVLLLGILHGNPNTTTTILKIVLDHPKQGKVAIDKILEQAVKYRNETAMDMLVSRGGNFLNVSEETKLEYFGRIFSDFNNEGYVRALSERLQGAPRGDVFLTALRWQEALTAPAYPLPPRTPRDAEWFDQAHLLLKRLEQFDAAEASLDPQIKKFNNQYRDYSWGYLRNRLACNVLFEADPEQKDLPAVRHARDYLFAHLPKMENVPYLSTQNARDLVHVNVCALHAARCFPPGTETSWVPLPPGLAGPPAPPPDYWKMLESCREFFTRYPADRKYGQYPGMYDHLTNKMTFYALDHAYLAQKRAIHEAVSVQQNNALLGRLMELGIKSPEAYYLLAESNNLPWIQRALPVLEKHECPKEYHIVDYIYSGVYSDPPIMRAVRAKRPEVVKLFLEANVVPQYVYTKENGKRTGEEAEMPLSYHALRALYEQTAQERDKSQHACARAVTAIPAGGLSVPFIEDALVQLQKHLSKDEPPLDETGARIIGLLQRRELESPPLKKLGELPAPPMPVPIPMPAAPQQIPAKK